MTYIWRYGLGLLAVLMEFPGHTYGVAASSNWLFMWISQDIHMASRLRVTSCSCGFLRTYIWRRDLELLAVHVDFSGHTYGVAVSGY